MYEPVELINQRLAERYGTDISSSKPNYRIVWSTHETEHRKSHFADFDDNGTFIRAVEEIRLVEKYPLYPDRWVLEVLQGNKMNPELIAKQSYEPIWVFGECNSDPNPLWRAVELMIGMHKFVDKQKKSQKDLDAEELLKIEKERRLFKEILQNDSPYIAGALAAGSAVTVPHNFESIKNEVKTDD